MTDIENRLSILEKKLGLAGNDILDTELRIEALERALLAEENGDVSIIVSKDSSGNKVKYNIVDATAVNRLKSYVDDNLKPEIFEPINEGIYQNKTSINDIIKEIYGQEKITDSESRIDYIEKILSNIINTLAYEASIRIESKYLIGSVNSGSGAPELEESENQQVNGSSSNDKLVSEKLNELETRIITLEESKAIIKVNQKLEELKEQVNNIDISSVNNKIDEEISLIEDELSKVIASFSDDLIKIEANIDINKSEINTLNNSVSSLELDVNTLNDKITLQTDNLDELKSSFDSFSTSTNNIIIDIIQDIGNNADCYNEISTIVQNNKNEIQENINALEKADETINEKIENINNELSEKINSTISNNTKNIETYLDNLDSKIDNVNNELNQRADNIDYDLESTKNNINEKIDELFSSLDKRIVNLNTAISQDINNNASKIEELDNLSNSLKSLLGENDKLDETLVARVTELESTDKQLGESISVLENKIVDMDNLDKTISEEIANIVANSPEDFDTLKEISDWIYEHKDSAASMNSDIIQNSESIEELKTQNKETENYIAALESVYNSKISDLEDKIFDLSNYILILEERILKLEAGSSDDNSGSI